MITNLEIRAKEVAAYKRGFLAGALATIVILAIAMTVIYLHVSLS